MSIILSQKSLTKLEGAHPDLRKVIVRAAALSDIDFTILEVTRTVARQRTLVASGASKTMRSRHIPGTGGFSHAVDVAPLDGGQVSWAWPLYNKLAPVIKQAAQDVGVPIEWGGDWRFKDGPHWQLPWKQYP
jgi:peptidoglycan L-alanyl-D-glutamate endopeptidase CwlK